MGCLPYSKIRREHRRCNGNLQAIVNNFHTNRLASGKKAVHTCLKAGMSVSPNRMTSPPATIFVVDDEPLLLDLAATILKPFGYNVLTFRDPRLALKEFPVVRPAVIVTDFAMGEMNGLDLTRECRRQNAEQKIILLSGTVDEGVYADLPDKPNRFLAKPYQVRELVASIQALVAI